MSMELKQYFRLCFLTALISAVLAIEYVCNPDDSIDVSGLPANYSYYAMQDVASPGADVECTVTRNNDTSVHITDCTKDLDILLTISTYEDMAANGLHGGKTVNAVQITCSEIPSTGNVHVVNNTFSANLTVTEDTAVNPTYEITSDLSTYSTVVGNEVIWTIYFPVEYILEITDCTAYAGTNDSSTEQVSLISSGGCNVTDELISHFTDNLNGTASATILAFKFYNEDDIFLQCNLKICPNTSDACDTTCSRTKRDIRPRHGRDAADEYYSKKVHAVLNVIQPLSLNGAVRISPFDINMALTLLLLVIVTYR